MKIKMILCCDEQEIPLRKTKNKIFFDAYYYKNPGKMTLWFRDFPEINLTQKWAWLKLNERLCQRLKQELPE